MDSWLSLIQTVLWVGLIAVIVWRFHNPIYGILTAIQQRIEKGGAVKAGPFEISMEKLAKALPAGTSFAWSGLSYQERLASGQTAKLYAVSILVVFLCLAALYESWSIPFSVLLVMPLGVVGAVAAITLRGLENDVYFQVALLTTIGLSAKNAILIVEFAEVAYRRGRSLVDAALEAAAAADFDDVACVHRRRVAAECVDRSGR